MNPITSFNAWVIRKVTNYLTAQEGFITEETNYTHNGIKAIVRDVFGYRYEIYVKTLSRVQGNVEDFNENYLSKTPPVVGSTTTRTR